MPLTVAFDNKGDDFFNALDAFILLESGARLRDKQVTIKAIPGHDYWLSRFGVWRNKQILPYGQPDDYD